MIKGGVPLRSSSDNSNIHFASLNQAVYTYTWVLRWNPQFRRMLLPGGAAKIKVAREAERNNRHYTKQKIQGEKKEK